ncbi:MAG: PqqD family protein [Candidatus Roizmanbacteria bacterium]|nr:PqqD family protein [Candidatus Roizmanbacteria bacterium]
MTSTQKVNKNLIVQKLEDSVVLFDSDASVLYTLNETATYIFTLLKKNVSKKDIVAQMKKRYGLDEKKMTADFDEVFNDFVKKGIITSKK